MVQAMQFEIPFFTYEGIEISSIDQCLCHYAVVQNIKVAKNFSCSLYSSYNGILANIALKKMSPI